MYLMGGCDSLDPDSLILDLGKRKENEEGYKKGKEGGCGIIESWGCKSMERGVISYPVARLL